MTKSRNNESATDSAAFFKLLNRAAQPRPQPSAKTSASHSSADCSDKEGKE